MVEHTTGQAGRTTPPEETSTGNRLSPIDAGPKLHRSPISRLAELPALLVNPVSIAGIVLACVCMGLIAVFIALEFTWEQTNPYLPIVGFMVLPSILVASMLLAPVGVLVRRRQLAGRGTKPGTLSAFRRAIAGDRNLWRPAVLALTGGFVAIGLLTTATVKGFEFGESATFCGLACHTVMKPEYVAYQSSTHSRVPCVECHIGPGPEYFVKAKLNGVSQLVALTTNSYSRPIQTPVESLRPSRDTCERCHWPERTYGDRLQVRKQYSVDERNTPREQTIVFRVGGGDEGSGVHWHVANEVWYFPVDRERQQIAWVEVRRTSGETQRYRDPAVADEALSSAQIEAGKRRLDCIDCHNRVAHKFPAFESEVDRALASGRLDPSIPHLKRLAVAMGPRANPSGEDSAEVKTRLAGLPAVYQQDYPRVFAARGAEIAAAAKYLEGIYENTVFPRMNVDSTTYLNNIGHNADGGCARCHGKLVADSGSGRPGPIVSNRCDLCHYAPMTTVESPGTLEQVAPEFRPDATASSRFAATTSISEPPVRLERAPR